MHISPKAAREKEERLLKEHAESLKCTTHNDLFFDQ